MLQLELFEITCFLPSSTKTKAKQNGYILLSTVERSALAVQSKERTDGKSQSS